MKSLFLRPQVDVFCRIYMTCVCVCVRVYVCLSVCLSVCNSGRKENDEQIQVFWNNACPSVSLPALIPSSEWVWTRWDLLHSI